MKTKKATVCIVEVVFGVMVLGSLVFALEGDIKESVSTLRKEAKELVRSENISEAAEVYEKLADIYEKLMAEEPNNRVYKNNYKHYLNRTGYVQLEYARKAAKKKRYALAANYYDLAVLSFEKAQKRMPGSRVFVQNIKYCRYYGGKARFANALQNHERAPAFSIEAAGGGKMELDEFKGGPVVVVLWAAWCPTSRKTIAMLKDIYRKYNPSGFKIASVSMDRVKGWSKGSSREKAEKIAAQMPFRTGWADEKMNYDYGSISHVPVMILLDKDLKIVKMLSSNDSAETLSAEIEKLL